MSGFNFGSGSTNTVGGFSFGATASTPAAAGTGGFTLGGAASTTSSLGLGGSLFAQKPTGGFSFNTPASGAPAASTAPTTGFSMAFNKPSASAQPFSLPAASSAPSGAGLTLGSILTSTAPQQGATGFALNLGGVAASTAPSTGLSLGSCLFSNMTPTG
uniref:Uncharacterized protein n=1 Tax=Hucho hucho TaxID=62062 RepID=A0A4W5JH09_9TELE